MPTQPAGRTHPGRAPDGGGEGSRRALTLQQAPSRGDTGTGVRARRLLPRDLGPLSVKMNLFNDKHDTVLEAGLHLRPDAPVAALSIYGVVVRVH